MKTEEIKLFMKANYPDIKNFNDLPFVKDIRQEVAKEIFNEFENKIVVGYNGGDGSHILNDKFLNLKEKYVTK